MVDIDGIRKQILANATMALSPPTDPDATSDGSNPLEPSEHGLEVVVVGIEASFVASVMVGRTPAIQSVAADTPEAALDKLLRTTAKLLADYVPMIEGESASEVVGGGVVDDEFLLETVVGRQLSSSD